MMSRHLHRARPPGNPTRVKYGRGDVENAILGYLIDIFDLSHPCYVYPIPIFLAIKISSAKKVKPGISQDKERYLLQS